MSDELMMPLDTGRRKSKQISNIGQYLMKLGIQKWCHFWGHLVCFRWRLVEKPNF